MTGRVSVDPVHGIPSQRCQLRRLAGFERRYRRGHAASPDFRAVPQMRIRLAELWGTEMLRGIQRSLLNYSVSS